MRAPAQLLKKRLNLSSAGKVLAQLAPLSSILCFICFFRILGKYTPEFIVWEPLRLFPFEAAVPLFWVFLLAGTVGALLLLRSRHFALGVATLLPLVWATYGLVLVPVCALWVSAQLWTRRGSGPSETGTALSGWLRESAAARWLAQLAPLSSVLGFICWFRLVDAKSPRLVSLALRSWVPTGAAVLLMFAFLAVALAGTSVLFASRRFALGAATLLPVVWVTFTVVWVTFTLVVGWAL